MKQSKRQTARERSMERRVDRYQLPFAMRLSYRAARRLMIETRHECEQPLDGSRVIMWQSVTAGWNVGYAKH